MMITKRLRANNANSANNNELYYDCAILFVNE